MVIPRLADGKMRDRDARAFAAVEMDADCQWCPADRVKAVFGIGRGTLYRMAAAREVRTVKMPGVRGARLFHVASIEAAMERMEQAQRKGAGQSKRRVAA